MRCAVSLEPAMTRAIETNGLTRRFGEFCAVDGLDLQVDRGKFYGFLGPNGAGKSTTIKMLTGLLAPSGGSMRILGEEMSDPDRAREIKRRIGVVPLFLAPGLLLDSVRREALAIDAEVAQPLGSALAELVLQRYDEARAAAHA